MQIGNRNYFVALYFRDFPSALLAKLLNLRYSRLLIWRFCSLRENREKKRPANISYIVS